MPKYSLTSWKYQLQESVDSDVCFFAKTNLNCFWLLPLREYSQYTYIPTDLWSSVCKIYFSYSLMNLFLSLSLSAIHTALKKPSICLIDDKKNSDNMVFTFVASRILLKLSKFLSDWCAATCSDCLQKLFQPLTQTWQYFKLRISPPSL